MTQPVSSAGYRALLLHSEDEFELSPTADAQPLITGEPGSVAEGRRSEEEALQTKPITYVEAINQLLKPSVNLTLSHLGTVLQEVVNGIVVRQLSRNEMAAIPFATAFFVEIHALVEGMLAPTGVFVGELTGAQEKAKIGEIVAQSWWIGGVLSLPTVLLLRNVSTFLNTFGIAEEVSQAAQEYCSAMSYGTLPLFLHVSDLYFAQGNNRSEIILVANTVSAVLSVFFSYAFALGAFGFPRLGVAGLGYGDALSSWLGFIGLRLYYKLSRQYDEFKLFDWHLPNFKDISTFLKVGLPMGLNDALTPANAIILSLLTGKLSKEAAVAQEVSSIPISAFNTLFMGLVLAISTEIANAMGELKAALERDEEIEVTESLQQNVKRLGNAGLIIGLSVACCACLLFTGFSKPISEIFLDASQDIPKETLPLAQRLLFISSVGLIFDTLKNISANNLLSMQDTLFALLLNTGGSLLGLSAGAYLSQASQKAEWLFTSQVLGSVGAALAITYWWFQKSDFKQNGNQNNNMELHRMV